MFFPIRASDGNEAATAAEEILRRYRAELCFEEETDGIVSYYCYSPRLGGGVILNGQKINLHIAVRGSSLAVGNPVVFGGY